MGARRIQHIEPGDGDRVGYRCFEHPRPRAIVIIASAMGVSQDYYAAFARWLASQGLIAYTFDYRGTGASLPYDGKLRGYRANIDDWARYDCAALIELADRRHPAMLSVASGSGYFGYNARPVRYYVLALWLVIVPLALRERRARARGPRARRAADHRALGTGRRAHDATRHARAVRALPWRAARAEAREAG